MGASRALWAAGLPARPPQGMPIHTFAGLQHWEGVGPGGGCCDGHGRRGKLTSAREGWHGHSRALSPPALTGTHAHGPTGHAHGLTGHSPHSLASLKCRGTWSLKGVCCDGGVVRADTVRTNLRTETFGIQVDYPCGMLLAQPQPQPHKHVVVNARAMRGQMARQMAGRWGCMIFRMWRLA
jgi:hypothetical protein